MNKTAMRLGCALLSLLLLSTTLVSCRPGERTPASMPDAPAFDDDTATATRTTPTSATTATRPPEPVVIAEYDITKIHPFFEERAWVDYQDAGKTKWIGLVDESGTLLYSEALSPGYTGMTYRFRDGYGCLWVGEQYKNNGTYKIIDRNGEIVYQTKIENRNSMPVTLDYLTHGDGVFLWRKHVSNFSENADYLQVTDAKGNVIEQLKGGEGIDTYRGEGIFCGGGQVYNANTHACFVWDRSWLHARYLASDFYNGVALSNNDYAVRPQDLASVDTAQAWIKNCETKAIVGLSTASDAGEGLVYTKSKGYYGRDYTDVEAYTDYEGHPVAGVSTYGDHRVKKYGAYRGGYTHIVLEGADKRWYGYVMDRNGETPYEPIKLEGDCVAYGGYIASSSAVGITTAPMQIISPEGKVTYSRREEREPIEIDEKFIYTENAVLDLRGNLVFDKVKVVSADGSGVSGGTETTRATGKVYRDVSGFSITGKWKNTGSYTFGQVQTNAIVVFDGSHCNVFSPQDTYAFTKNGSNYRLDCTSVLFSQTVSFTVKIVDNDHIDVYNGANYLELTRVQ